MKKINTNMVTHFLKSCLFMTTTVFCVDLMSMNQPLVQTDNGTMLAPETVVAEIITRDPLLLDHDTICSFAMTNKHYHKYMLDTAPQRKEFLTQHDAAVLKDPVLFCACDRSRRLWHQYGSSYAMAEAVTHVSDGKKTLILLCRYLTGDRNIAHTSRTFMNFSSFLDEKPAPFVNENGVISFYGYGIMEVGRKAKHCLVRYDLDTAALLSPCFPCFFRVKYENGAFSEARIMSSNFWFFANQIPLNSLPATKEERKRYSYFGEFSEECIMIDLINIK